MGALQSEMGLGTFFGTASGAHFLKDVWDLLLGPIWEPWVRCGLLLGKILYTSKITYTMDGYITIHVRYHPSVPSLVQIWELAVNGWDKVFHKVGMQRGSPPPCGSSSQDRAALRHLANSCFYIEPTLDVFSTLR